MDSISVSIDHIKNKACIVCGKGFSSPRAGKLYCSPSCKQFAFYHKAEISALETAKKGISDQSVRLNMKDYELYNSTLEISAEYHSLLKRSTYTFTPFEPHQAQRLNQLENNLPGYLKKNKPPRLTIEKWSFIKLLYPTLEIDEFIKLLCSMDNMFFQNLSYEINSKEGKNNPIRISYQNHLSKIAEGLIKFL